jgi:hypothetical protein
VGLYSVFNSTELNKETRNMTNNSKITQVLLGTAFAAMAGFAANDANAQALQAGQCDIPMARFNQALLSEGQRTLVVGDRIGVANDPTSPTGVRTARFVNGITGSPDGNSGYRYEGNRPMGQISETVCVRAVLTNVGLFDARRPEIARRAYLGGRFNQAVDESAREGERPMIVADTVFGTGSSRSLGTPIVVFGDLAERTGSVDTLLSNGDPTSITSLDQIAYTETALNRLNSRQVASLNTNTPN